MIDWLQNAHVLFPFSQAVRRDLHQHPELGYKEIRTAGIIARELRELGMEVTTGVAETGVIGLLEGAKPGPVVLVRFDMDALPVLEQTGAEYASCTSGAMHACGHDGHVAVGLTAARLLSAQRDHLNGTIKFVFQPAEEGLGGAERMVAEGVLVNPRVDACLALHIWNEMPLGWFGIPAGPLMASADIFHIRLEGKGGHGALPHTTVDPVAAAAQMINALQTIVSRNVSPLQSAVISVTQVHAGETFNVIPQYAEMSGTVRAFEPVVRALVLERLDQVVKGMAQVMNCNVTLELSALTPPVINTPAVAAKVAMVAQKLHPNALIDREYRTMVSEDMAFMMKDIPSCYFMVGSANQQKGLNYSHHHPKFDFDEQVLSSAAAAIAAAAAELLA
jgi:amidohydrolase